MTISVVIPIFNCERTLERAARSILDQTLQPSEIICVLNCCTDSSEDILKKLSKDNGNLKIVKCNTKGIVPALNFGLYNSSADCTLIARMDADDWSYPTRFEKQINFLKENPEIDILGTQMRVVDKYSFNQTGVITNNPLTDSQIKANMLNSCNSIAHPSVVFKKVILERLGGYQDHGSMKYVEDLDLWLRATRSYKFANLSEVLIDYSESKNQDYDPRAPQLLAHNMRQINSFFP